MPEELIGIIGGSGLDDALTAKLADARIVQVDTPFGKPSGDILVGKIGQNKIAFLNRHGQGHKLAPSEVPFAANMFALKKVGVHTLIASCAVGSLNENIHPKELVIPDQFIDKTYKRQSSFFEATAAVHCEMAEPVCGRMRKILFETAGELDVKVHNGGTYICMEGPQFSTKAESLMNRKIGGDLIGMTAMPEAKLAREAQMCYAMVALVSDYDCWRKQKKDKDKQTLLQEIIGNLNEAAENAINLIEQALEKNSNLHSADCPCRSSLELAVWTKPEWINKEQKEKLSVLFE